MCKPYRYFCSPTPSCGDQSQTLYYLFLYYRDDVTGQECARVEYGCCAKPYEEWFV